MRKRHKFWLIKFQQKTASLNHFGFQLFIYQVGGRGDNFRENNTQIEQLPEINIDTQVEVDKVINNAALY